MRVGVCKLYRASHQRHKLMPYPMGMPPQHKVWVQSAQCTVPTYTGYALPDVAQRGLPCVC